MSRPYKMPCMRKDFSQALDSSRPHTLLTENPKRSADLVYRYDDTGETALVPNIWYNQTFQVRAEAIRWDAMRAEERAIKYEAGPPYGMSAATAADIARRYREYAARIRSEATRMEVAGSSEYPVRAARMDVNYGDAVTPY